MWQYLSLSSLGVIESAELELGSGFSVITGETARVEASITVPAGHELAARIEEAGGEVDDDALVIGRTLSAQGRSRAVAGGATVPASLLAEVTDQLVAVHGQSDQHRLLRPAAQREALDRFAGQPLVDVLEEYTPAHQRWRSAQSRLAELRTNAQERARELDLLQHGLQEIETVEPVEGEDETLKAEESRLAYGEALVRAADVAHAALSGDPEDGPAHDRVSLASAALADVTGHDPALDALGSRVAELAILLDDVAGELAAYAASIDVDPARLSVVQERRAALTSLQRKYGPGLDDVLAWREKAAARAGEIDHDDDAIEALEAEIAQLGPVVLGLAAQLSQVRSEAAERLGRLVGEELTALAMPSARLAVAVTQREGADPAAHGLDDVELLFAANNGSDPRPLSKGASGGELSRLMLALEVVLADRTTVPTMVFDEVDAGIGGGAAVEVGRRLARLAGSVQVLAVTHLPQVAAFADHHFHVSKADDGAVTRSSVTELVGQDRVDELARMLAGLEESATAQAHARELLELAQAERS